MYLIMQKPKTYIWKPQTKENRVFRANRSCFSLIIWENKSITWDERKKTLHEGKLQGQIVEKTKKIAHKFSGKWIRNGFFDERDRGHIICSSIKAKIDKQPVPPKCRLCGIKEDTVMHLNGYPKLAQKQYKRRQDNVARRVTFGIVQEAWSGKLRQMV